MIQRDKYMRIRSPAQLLVGVKLTPRQLGLACCAAVHAASSYFDHFDDDDYLRHLTAAADRPNAGPVSAHYRRHPEQGQLSLYLRRLSGIVGPAAFSKIRSKYHYRVFLADLHRCVWYEDRSLRHRVTAAVRSVVGDPYDARDCPESADRHVIAIATHIRETLEFDQMTVLGDALEDAGSTDEALLNRCRGEPCPYCADAEISIGDSGATASRHKFKAYWNSLCHCKGTRLRYAPPFHVGDWSLDTCLGLPRATLLPPRTKKR